MSELDNVLSTATTLGEKTKATYTSTYKRLMRLTGGKALLNMSEKSIIADIDVEGIPPNSKELLTTVSIVIRRQNNASFERLINFRDNTLKKRIHERKLAKNLELKDELPTKDVLEIYMKKLYIEKDYTGYVINFLLLNFGVRNMDLHCLITTDKEVTLKSNENSKINYLYVTKKYVMYIRNNYKTFATYGRKTNKIERRPFVIACNALLQDHFDVPLLKLDSGEAVSEKSINKVVQRRTYNELGEGKIFKINILDAKKARNIKRIRELAASRGTSIETVFRQYDISGE